MIPRLIVALAHPEIDAARRFVEVAIGFLERSPAAPANALAKIDEALTGFDDVEHLAPLTLRHLVPDCPSSSSLHRLLLRMDENDLFCKLRSKAEGQSARAGLFLIHDFLDDGHRLAQEADNHAPNSTAAYWHAIMHRREPDCDNARFWFRRVGKHPVFPLIGREVATLLASGTIGNELGLNQVLDNAGHWDAASFVDLCDQCGMRWDRRAQVASRFQEIEMRLLLEYTCRAAE